MKTTIVILALILVGCAEGQYRSNPQAAAEMLRYWNQSNSTSVPTVMPVTNCQSTSRYDIYGAYIGEAVQCGQ